jgi:hypothetical protein
MSLGQQRSGTNVRERQTFPCHQREELVQQLETLSLKVHDAPQINMSIFVVSVRAEIVLADPHPKKKNSVALVCEGTTPLVGEVSANFCG